MLLERKNLVNVLLKERNRAVTEDALMADVRALLDRDEKQREAIRQRLEREDTLSQNHFVFDLLETDRIFHLSHIKKICVDYRLRFLDSHLFRGGVPEEAVSKIKQLEKEHDTQLSGFRIAAPSKLFHLRNYDDPLLFAPIGNGYYYLVHKWGNDMSAWRKWQVLPVKNFGNFLVLMIAVSILFSLFALKFLFTGTHTNQFLLLTFLFTFKSVCGIALYYCFWKGKNFNNAIWDSEYYNK